jgi:hypothetical protein
MGMRYMRLLQLVPLRLLNIAMGLHEKFGKLRLRKRYELQWEGLIFCFPFLEFLLAFMVVRRLRFDNN